jgi:hypothetical protein
MLSQAEEIIALRRATDETKAMVEERFPFVVEVGANDDSASFRWPAAAAGLLARGSRSWTRRRPWLNKVGWRMRRSPFV